MILLAIAIAIAAQPAPLSSTAMKRIKAMMEHVRIVVPLQCPQPGRVG